ncbi:MAG: C39 family peptidase [Candidatus Altimarinota bacterium]
MSKKGFAQLAVIVVGAGILSVGGYAVYKSKQYEKQPVPQAIEISDLNQNIPEQAPISDSTPTASEPSTIIPPEELNLKMTFYSQAPFGDWSLPWQEACEESSALLIANTYFNRNWTREEFNQEILDLVDWENQTFGHYEHTDMAETATILEDYLSLETVTHENPTFNDFKEILAKGNFIIIPFSGQTLNNPYYTGAGPVYHVMVVKGYTKDGKIITHDVGTRHGEDYVYSWATVEKSLHDYAEPISSGAPRIIEVLQPQGF